MPTFLSRLRLRTVKSRAHHAARPRKRRPLRDSDALRFGIGVLAWVLVLWLTSPAGLAEWRQFAARGVALLIIGLGGQMLLRVICPGMEPERSSWWLMLAMLLLSVVDVRVSVWTTGHLLPVQAGTTPVTYGSPHAFVPLMVAMLYGGPMSLVIGLISGVVMALADNFDLGVFLISLCATAVSACEGPRIRNRLQMAGTLGRIALWQIPVLLAMSLAGGGLPDTREVVMRVVSLLLWLVVSGVLVILLLPLAQRITGRVSNYCLNGFADLGHTLLQRMTLEAPGTYHHSMMVANLAQSAADRIGANGLLARVGAYYHDIGKLGRPPFYMENQMRGDNPHDDLPPNISRMIIVNHVKEGLVLARLHHLPVPVVRFIEVHHGTSLIRWFHHKARNQAGQDGKDAGPVDESHYRYDNPLPVTREETIVTLADSIEAAARALPKVTNSSLENLVGSICKAKWSDGQLDQSELTQSELAQVRSSFVFTLMHLLHARQAYPSNDDQRKDTEKAEDKDQDKDEDRDKDKDPQPPAPPQG